MTIKGQCEHDWDMDVMTCVFGCNRKVDEDTGFCPECHDHSQNVVECKKCQALGIVDHFNNNEVTVYGQGKESNQKERVEEEG